MLKKFLLLAIASLVMLPALADKPPDKGKGNKDGGGVFLSVVFRDDYCNNSDGDNFCSDTGDPYINDKESVGAHIDKFRFGLNVGLNGTRHFFLDLRNCTPKPGCEADRPFNIGLTTGWNVFATSPDGAQYLRMSANGTGSDHSKPVNFQLEFLDPAGQEWRIMFNPDECPGVEPDDMVTVTKTSDSPDTWEFEATADKLACLQFREGPRRNHFIAGLYSLPFLITAQAIE